MKALTIRNPHAYLIVTPQDELPPGIPQKLCENRGWTTKHRGSLLIHSSVSRYDMQMVNYIEKPHAAHLQYGHSIGEVSDLKMKFGFIVGVADLANIKPIREFDAVQRVGIHYATGPFCWLFRAVQRFPKPIPYQGRQGVFEVPDELVAEQLHSIAWE